ncbi:hypothetical protein QUB05_05925 [Microcoleus sp. F10-C6]|uniref:hypothetical protein n=1 Tax=unclassified Microcoleus TaxID=2642155 RepID=UPI002FCF8A41
MSYNESKKIYAAYEAFIGSLSEKSNIFSSEIGDVLGLAILSRMIGVVGIIISLLLLAFTLLAIVPLIVPLIVFLICAMSALFIEWIAEFTAKNQKPNVIDVAICSKEQVIYQSRSYRENVYYIHVYIKSGYRVDSKGEKTMLPKLKEEIPNFKGKFRFQVNPYLWDDLQLDEEVEIVTTKGCYVFDKLVNILSTDNPKYPHIF